MGQIVGVVPAGGTARRIHGFFKEMMPIGVNDADRSKFVVSSEQIIEKMLFGGATSVHFVLGSQKLFVAQYFTNQRLFEGRINFNFLAETIEVLGMPYTVDSIFDQLKSYEYVMLGMPDTILEPVECFRSLLSLLMQTRADLSLGLFRTDMRNRGGYVKFDPTNKRVRSHVDKTSVRFPEGADNAWAIACWNAKFTNFVHTLLREKSHPVIQNTLKNGTELLFGDMIDAAIADSAINVVADFVDEGKGFYWDITKPEKYFQLLRHYSPGEVGEELVAGVPGGGENWQEPSCPRRLLKRLCERFPFLAETLSHRHNQRATISIADEYDVQDILHGVLKLHFTDVRPEEWTPSYAGHASRMDFLLKKEQIVVEAKMTRKGLGQKELIAQLTEDIFRYQAHQDCKTLVCFVYDPAGLCHNPTALENDLTRSSGPFDVIVVVRPQHR